MLTFRTFNIQYGAAIAEHGTTLIKFILWQVASPLTIIGYYMDTYY